MTETPNTGKDFNPEPKVNNTEMGSAPDGFGGPPEGGGGPPREFPTVRQNMIPERTYSFETPPEPIPPSSIKETITAEVVVVGGGIAGLSAALSAAEVGAKTIIVEKTNRFYSFGGDVAAIGSRLQKKLGIEIDPGEVVLNLMKYGANKPDHRIIRMWAEGSGATMDWLMEMTDPLGINVTIFQFPPPAAFNNANEYYPQYLTTHVFPEGSVVNCLKDNAVKRGVGLYPNNRAKQLLRDGKGRVTGVVAQNAEGSFIQFNARKAVILCTGDYSYNDEMMAKYCPQTAYMPSMMKRATGDGHQMALWVGAAMEPAPHAPMNHGFAGPIGNYPFLQVNLKGERFHNEDVPGQSYTNAIERQPEKQAWQIFDSKYLSEIPYMGIGHGKYNLNDRMRGNMAGRMLKADTIEELGEKMEIPLATFKATIDRYNELARLGKDLDFSKQPDRLTTIDKPPYYAGKGHYTLLVVMGGINVNHKLQALDKDYEAVPGLYMAGNTMGNRFAVDYPTICPGISLGMALHYGRVAGINAVTLEK